MIKRIKIKQYRKFKQLELNMSPSLNAISGTNGTCKTSLLHMISNSFKAVSKTATWIENPACIQVLNAVNDVVNPKVESLTRGDKKYNDPAHGISGTLYSVDYFNHSSLDFRRHNSDINSRYAIKPTYKRGSGDSLPACPVVYLGLSRLVPYGEFTHDDSVKTIKMTLPSQYQEELKKVYESFTHYDISETSIQKMGDVKLHAEFDSKAEGIDSNTISAGEDNLYIILLALISLKYYFESIETENVCESILLVDELDATLHPAFQIRLLGLLREYSKKYKIQVFFTTHSMTMLEDLLEKKDNVFYLIDNVTNVALMEEPDIYKIKMQLNSLTKKDIYYDKVIPVFSEDSEARYLIQILFDYYEEYKPEFKNVRRLFHFVNVNLGAENLEDLFKDFKLLRSTMKAICVLDGDQKSDLKHNIVTLPGKPIDGSEKGLSPEKMLFEYADILYKESDSFWTNDAVISIGYGKKMYLERIIGKITQYEKMKESGDTKKSRREFNKSLFNEHKEFFTLLFKRWLMDERTNSEKDKFFNDLKILFRKNAIYNGINPNEWKTDN